ncbi:MAG: hypothetical protein ACUVRO_11690 [Armatimonadota bacterium]
MGLSSVYTSEISDSWRGMPCTYTVVGPWHVWVLGEVSGVDRYPETPLEPWPLPPAVPNRVNGHCAVIAWNDDERRWHVWTNRFGTMHVYYGCRGGRSALGTYSPAVAATVSASQLDWVGITAFFAFGFFPHDRTYNEEVRVLRPASHYVFDERGRIVKQERYWRWHYEPDTKRAYDDTIAEFADLFRAVMQDLLRKGRIAVPISGGLDSRSTVAVVDSILAKSGRLWSYSYGYAEASAETCIAHQVAATRDLPFSSFVIAPYLFDRLADVLACTEGFQDITQPRQASVVEEIGRHADFVIAAHWGDVWLDDMGLCETRLSLSNEQVADYAMHKIMKRGCSWLLEKVCTSHLAGESVEGLLADMVRAEMRPLECIADPDFRVKAFKTESWSFRWTLASIRTFQAAVFPRLPFYDTRLTDFFCTVPTAHLKGRRLQIDYLKRFAPDLARIKWQPYDADLYSYHRHSTWHLPRRAFKKAWRVLTRQRVIQRNWEVQFLNDRGRDGLRQWLLRPGLRLHDLVSPSAVRELLGSFYANPSDSGLGYAVSMLLTFAAWLEHYG